MPAEEACGPSRSSTCSGDDASATGPGSPGMELTGSIDGGLAAADAAAVPRSAAASACDSIVVKSEAKWEVRGVTMV